MDKFNPAEITAIQVSADLTKSTCTDVNSQTPEVLGKAFATIYSAVIEAVEKKRK